MKRLITPIVFGIVMCLASPGWAPNRHPGEHMLDQDCTNVTADDVTLKATSATDFSTYELCLRELTGSATEPVIPASDALHAYASATDFQASASTISVVQVDGQYRLLHCYTLTFPASQTTPVPAIALAIKYPEAQCLLKMTKTVEQAPALIVADVPVTVTVNATDPTTPTPIVCADGTAVSDASACPAPAPDGDLCPDGQATLSDGTCPEIVDDSDTNPCTGDQIFEPVSKQCFDNVDSDGDGIVDGADHCPAQVDPTNACADVAKSQPTPSANPTLKPSFDGGEGCSIVTDAQLPTSLYGLLAILVATCGLAITRQFRKGR